MSQTAADEQGFSLADFVAARRLLIEVSRQTPVVGASWLARRVGGPVWLKCENLQRSGSFKVRGAYVRMARLPVERRAAGVVAASAGNHAQGVAVAAKRLGIEATIFMPRGAALPKVEATLGYGADVQVVGDTVDEALAAATEFAQDQGAELIHPFDHRDVLLGQGTVGMEIIEQVPDVRTVVVPTGGGGLLAGIAAAVGVVRPGVRVVGVQAAGAAAYPPSIAAGHPVALDQMSTMADGIAVGRPGAVPLSVVLDSHVEVRTVAEVDLAKAAIGLLERSKQVVEPAGVAAVASLLNEPERFEPPVVAVLSGGNVDPVVLMRVIRYGLAGAGRYLSLGVQLPDRPGSLAAFLTVLSACDVNVLDVDHLVTNPRLSIGEVDVVVQVETRGRVHREETLHALRELGYSPRLIGEDEDEHD